MTQSEKPHHRQSEGDSMAAEDARAAEMAKNERQAELAERGKEVGEITDALLDEIDAALGDTAVAQEFVANYVQKGGE